MREVWAGELAMIASGGKVISLRGVTLVVKIAQRDCPAIGPYSGVPPALSLVPGDTPEFGARASTGRGVAGILGMCGGAKIGPSIVKAIAVYVVNKQIAGDVQNLAMHFDGNFLFQVGQPFLSLGIKGGSAPVGVPVVLGQSRVVCRVNDCIAGLREGDSAEGIAVPETANKQQQAKTNSVQAGADCDADDQYQNGPPGQ